MTLLSWAKPFVERFPRVATAYRELRDSLDVTNAKVTPWGFSLAGNASMANGTFEPEETELVRRLLTDVDVLVNVGANVGYYCCHALSMGKGVIAFEPLPRNVRYLCANIKANGWSCEIFPIALSDRVGIQEIYGGDTGASLVKGWAGSSEAYVTLVPSLTLDLALGTRLLGKKVLVVLDVEGAEKWVLDGSSILLANNPKPFWLMEIAVNENQPDGLVTNPRLRATFQTMFDAGYFAFTGDRQMRPITGEDVISAERGDSAALETHNFLFCQT
ncbi:MAG TPA: FkbM family methyltransferase [Gemmatimonadaceae bacterium]|nr:FkbM family methyltransferase [Gemmatimonadaceae bacterium]